MGRPPIEDNPLYREVKAMYEPLKSKVANARIMAEAMVANAKAEVDREMLAVVKYGIENGLSRSAIGRITGKTSNADQIALVERALAEGYVPVAAASALKPAEVEPEASTVPTPPKPEGWEVGDVQGEADVDATAILESPDGELIRMSTANGGGRGYVNEMSGVDVSAEIPVDVDVYVAWLIDGSLPDWWEQYAKEKGLI